jgi:hypothetical protein
VDLKVGNRVDVESESAQRGPRKGVIEEVVRDAPSPRYRIRWDDGHESIYPCGRAAASRRTERESVSGRQPQRGRPRLARGALALPVRAAHEAG